MSKTYIGTEELRLNSYRLASNIIQDGFRPDFMVALWRGGASIGMYVHETLKWCNIKTDHIAIRTSKYTGIDQASQKVEIHNLGYLCERLKSNTKLLIVDDIFDTGHTIFELLKTLQQRLGSNYPTDTRVATIYYKPKRNQTIVQPNYYIFKSNEWVVFPHEVEGETVEEITSSKGKEIGDIFRNLKKIGN